MALVSENFAREYWGTPENALGKRIRVGNTDDWREIIGVAGDVYDDGVSQEPRPPCTGRCSRTGSRGRRKACSAG